MKDRKVHINALKYLRDRNADYTIVDLNEFLLSTFEEKQNCGERGAMRNLLTFLEKNDYIASFQSYGIDVFRDQNLSIIPRENISALVKLRPKGYELLNEHDKIKINKISIGINILFGLITIVLTIWGTNLSKDQERLKSDFSKLKSEVESLKKQKVIQQEKLKTLNKKPNG